MIVTLKDGSKKEYAEAKSVIDIAYDISEGLARAACAGEVNGEVVDLRTVIDSDCELNILTAKDEKGLAVLRHTASHVLAQAVQTLFPDAKVAIGPSIDTGFYYDFDCPPFSRDDLDAIEKEMKKIIKKGAKIERFTKSREDAIAYFQEKNEPYKVELIEDLPEGSEISFYSQGDWTDLCAGPHLMSVKGVKAFKLLSSSSAYWRGSEKNAMLTRIYGTAYASKDELKEHLEQMEEAKRRDHNKLGREMKIFTTVDVIGQGLPLIMPNGVIMMQELQRWIEDEETKRGYIRTKTPLMAKSDLYKISGHWDHYKDGMFVLGDEETDKEVFALRPMTCPFQYYVYKAEQHSYRDLPLRYGETSTLFRNEDSGEMHGLTRVRQFTISEGHLIVRPDQMVKEFKDCIALAQYCLQVLGVEEDVTYHLSKWDPNNKEKYIGDAEVWNQTEAHIRQMLEELNIPFTEDVGEAAFYGPKVDINAKNVYGKEDTMITIQWDALLAEQFDMYYIDENGVEPKPGLLPMIRDLQRMRMRVALATATPEVRARKYLRMVGVEDAFDAVACAEMVAHGKPAPDVYLLAAQKLDLPPEELLGVEDSPSGVRSAHSAGMTVAMIPDQDEPSTEIAALCALVAPTLEGIMPFIEKLNANKFG